MLNILIVYNKRNNELAEIRYSVYNRMYYLLGKKSFMETNNMDNVYKSGWTFIGVL